MIARLENTNAVQIKSRNFFKLINIINIFNFKFKVSTFGFSRANNRKYNSIQNILQCKVFCEI